MNGEKSFTTFHADGLRVGPHTATVTKTVEPLTEPAVRERLAFKVGDTLMGCCKVLEELGRGGMGIVYKVFHAPTETFFALKVVPPELAHSRAEIERLRDNFALVEKLNHPNIANAKLLIEDPERETYYLLMEYVEGETLRAWMRRQWQTETLTLETIAPILRQIAEALDYAHRMRVLHRDIKPSNIMVQQDGTVKVLDFGLAEQIQTTMTYVSMAQKGPSGTAPYMAPEQWMGVRQSAMTDQYALAVVCYEMLAGRLPFENADTEALQQAVLKQKPEPLSLLSRRENKALLRAFSKTASERFKSCLAFVEACLCEKVKKGKVAPYRPHASMATSAEKGQSVTRLSALLMMQNTYRPPLLATLFWGLALLGSGTLVLLTSYSRFRSLSDEEIIIIFAFFDAPFMLFYAFSWLFIHWNRTKLKWFVHGWVLFVLLVYVLALFFGTERIDLYDGYQGRDYYTGPLYASYDNYSALILFSVIFSIPFTILSALYLLILRRRVIRKTPYRWLARLLMGRKGR